VNSSSRIGKLPSESLTALLHATFVLEAAALGLIPFLATTFLDLLAGLDMEEAFLAEAAAAGTAAFVGLPATRGISQTATALVHCA
jgi:hypothetical protein